MSGYLLAYQTRRGFRMEDSQLFRLESEESCFKKLLRND